ncbi:MerR family transcriptional regulator [uncultured Flavonifractor sp.]|uniref:MerR family transcriptional regulator n=1 Tax=uncultured Flavonifractor sp. TaxID=1193534 RepID=UPI002605A5DC|nr:MerR family transcriptional regulator [uncultured Flavonifractor sp.]
MKMKQVCEATGLTERAVRFYVQEQLVIPQAQRRGGRIWLDFSEQDVARLQAIAVLRKAGFTLEEIRSMEADFQRNAPDAAFALRRRLREAIDSYERLSRTDTAHAHGLEDYAALLEQEVRDTPLPTGDQRLASQLDWASIIETVCMILFSCIVWWLYAYLVNCGSDASALFAVAARNPVAVILVFVVLILPIGLVLGSRAGKWLCRHFEYIP